MEILGIGYQEILLVAALIVIVVGPRRLPEMAYYLGRGVKKLQRYARVVRDEFGEEFAYLNDEMEAVRADMKEVRGTVQEVQDELAEVRGEVVEVSSEAMDELGGIQPGIEQAAAEAGAPSPAGASGTNGAAAAPSGVNGAGSPRGVPGPSYMPPIGTLEPRERPVAPESRTAPEPPVETDGEAEAKPEKPLVF